MGKVAAIQMTSTMDLAHNLTIASRLLKNACDAGAGLVVLPEMFALQQTPADNLRIAEHLGQGKVQDFLAEQARKNQIWIVGGTIPIRCDNPSKARSACLVFNDKGERVARYDKSHLFDVKVSETESYQESDTIEAGTDWVVLDTPFGRLGLAVCFDIRFSEMFRYLFHQGVEIFAFPYAFTVKTGQAHFEILARARAIETFSYFIAAGETGDHLNGRKTYGHSMIISPWGDLLASLDTEEGIITADIDLNTLHEIRQNIPVFE